MTFIVGELASCFGCAVSLPDAVTAFSFVALGTSLPDTFASRQAAQESPDADAAIGNVTGVYPHEYSIRDSRERHRKHLQEIFCVNTVCMMQDLTALMFSLGWESRG